MIFLGIVITTIILVIWAALTTTAGWGLGEITDLFFQEWLGLFYTILIVIAWLGLSFGMAILVIGTWQWVAS